MPPKHLNVSKDQTAAPRDAVTMRTRNTPSGTTVQSQGRLFKKAKQSPCIRASKRKPPLQKHNIQDSTMTNKSPAYTRKKIHSEDENSRENCINLNESLSPIIKSRRKPLGQSKLIDLTNLCRDASCGDQGPDKEKNAPLKISNSCLGKVSPLEERMNVNTPKRGKIIEDDKRQAVRKRSAVSDKENVLAVNMTQAPVRKSKRTNVASRYKNALNLLMPVKKKPPNKKQNDARVMPETDRLSKKETSSLADEIEVKTQPRPQKVVGTRNLRSSSSTAQLSAATMCGGKEVSTSTCGKDSIAAGLELPSNERKNARPSKDTTLSPGRMKRKSSQVEKDSSAKKTDIRMDCETPKVSGTSTRTTRCGELSAKIGKGSKLSSKLPRKSSNTSQNKEPMGSSDSQLKSKPPVWASVRGTKVTPGKRKSFRINSDAYDFPSSPQEEQANVKKRRVTKPRKVKKKTKPNTKFTLLTTDPSWQGTACKGMPFLSASSLPAVSKNSASAKSCNNSASDAGDETSAPSIMSSIRSERSAEEDLFVGFEPEVPDDTDDLFTGFEGETRSSFVIPAINRNGNDLVPMISASVLPTPALSKHMSKFLGGSSTPRMENIAEPADNQEARKANDSIAQCFGFDDESEEESELSLSPVQKSRQRHSLEVTGTSDVTDGELHPASLPSRFSWSSLRPGNWSRASSTRSLSMVAQGRSTTFMTDTSRNSQTNITSFAVPSVSKQHLRPRQVKPARQERLQDTARSEAEPDDRREEAEVSVLFDEDEMMGKQSSEDKAASEASHLSSRAPKSFTKAPIDSPEKSFVKAPRKSYDRASLLEARRKFIEMHGGFANECSSQDEGDTEEDEEEAQVKHQPKTRKKPAKMTKKKEKKSVKVNEEASKKTAASSSKTKKKKKKKETECDPVVEEWASHLNCHFSEVDETVLVVE